jgi:hypothetical protein
MIEPGDEDLLHGEIDGENTADESAILQGRLAERPELRARYEELVSLARTLARLEEVEPPGAMAADIMRVVRQKPPAGPRPAASIGTFPSASVRRSLLRPAWGFAAGLAVGALLATFIERSSPVPPGETSALSATLLPESRLGPLHDADQERFAVEGVQGRVETKVSEDVVVAEITVESPRELELEVGFDPNVFTPRGFERGATATSGVELGLDGLRLRHAGQDRYRLILKAHGPERPPLRLKLSGEGVDLERTVGTRRPGS